MSVVPVLGTLPVPAFAEVDSQAERTLPLVVGTAGVEPSLSLLSAQGDFDISSKAIINGSGSLTAAGGDS